MKEDKLGENLKAFLKTVDDNCDVDRYMAIYNRVRESGAAGVVFTGNDHHYAGHLFEWGYLRCMMTPMHNGFEFRGIITAYYSLIEPDLILGDKK